MDLWLMPDNHNKIKLLQALKKFGINPADLKKLEALDFTETRMFFIGEAPDKIDFLIGNLVINKTYIYYGKKQNCSSTNRNHHY